ncbi:hypothetical protein HDZ31DRAFT_33533 [Schizophyllum fasciatum]
MCDVGNAKEPHTRASSEHDIQHSQERQNNDKGKRKMVFGLHQSYGSPRSVNPFDYEQKYDEDEYGEELGPNARFWRVLLDEGHAYDSELVESWRDTLDVLLVFALQPDYAQITVSLLAELVALQRALAIGKPSDDVPRSILALDAVTASTLDHWCNALWFISLALSLSAALMSVLIKQWLQAYNSNISGTPRHQALIRQFRLIGVERWNVPLIVGLLPMLLHLSLLLFLVGLSLFLFTFDSAIAWIIAGLAILFGYVAFRTVVASAFSWLRRHTRDDTPSVLPSADAREPPAYSSYLSAALSSLSRFLSRLPSSKWPFRSREADAVSLHEDALTTNCLTWAFSTSSNPTVSSITVQAASGLPPQAPQIVNSAMLEMLKHEILCCFRRSGDGASATLILVHGQERKEYQPAKSCTLLALFLWHSAGRAHRFVPHVFQNPLTMGAVSLYTLCASDPHMGRLVNDAVHRLLCGLRVHMLQRALEIYASETFASPFQGKRLASGFDDVDDANIGFLARYLDEVPHQYAWDLLGTVTRIIGHPGLSLQTHHLFFYVYYLQEGHPTTEMPPSAVRPLFAFLVKLLAAAPLVEQAAAHEHIDYLTRANTDQPCHLVWCLCINALVAAMNPQRTSPLRSALRTLAELTARLSTWEEVMRQAMRQPVPLALGMALADARSMEVYIELAQLLFPDRAVYDMPEIRVRIAGEGAKLAETWYNLLIPLPKLTVNASCRRCAVREASSRPPQAGELLSVSDLVTLEEYNQRWRRAYGPG